MQPNLALISIGFWNPLALGHKKTEPEIQVDAQAQAQNMMVVVHHAFAARVQNCRSWQARMI